MMRLTRTLLYIFAAQFLGISAMANSDSLSNEVKPTLENLYYGNVNEVITKMLWIGDQSAIGLRYNEKIPKDLVLLNRNKLIVDSLSFNEMFLQGYDKQSGRFTSIDGLIQTSENKFLVIHGHGTTILEINQEKLNGQIRQLEKRKPAIDEKYLQGYSLVQLENYTIGYRKEMNKYLTSADFWVYDWGKKKHVAYLDSQHPQASKNWYWKLKDTPETYSSSSIYRYNITETRDGFIFNLPLKNRFLKYSKVTGEIHGYTFPELDKKSQAWFAFYDWKLDRVFPVLDTGKDYRIYSLDRELKNFYYLASATEQPFGVMDGKVYLREIEFKEKNKTWFCNHYLVDLYPKVK